MVQWKQEMRANGIQGRHKPSATCREIVWDNDLPDKSSTRRCVPGRWPLVKGHFLVQAPADHCGHQQSHSRGNWKMELKEMESGG